MYSGEPNSITKLAEFSLLTTDVQRLYNDQILRAIRAWAPTINKWWSDLPVSDKELIKGMFKQSADQMIANAGIAKKKNGVEIMKMMLKKPSDSPSQNTYNNTSVSTYMVQPFMPMVSGFSLQDALDKATAATQIA